MVSICCSLVRATGLEWARLVVTPFHFLPQTIENTRFFTDTTFRILPFLNTTFHINNGQITDKNWGDISIMIIADLRRMSMAYNKQRAGASTPALVVFMRVLLPTDQQQLRWP